MNKCVIFVIVLEVYWNKSMHPNELCEITMIINYCQQHCNLQSE